MPPSLREMGLCPEILVIQIDKNNKMWEGINRCLEKGSTQKISDLPKVRIGDLRQA